MLVHSLPALLLTLLLSGVEWAAPKVIVHVSPGRLRMDGTAKLRGRPFQFYAHPEIYLDAIYKLASGVSHPWRLAYWREVCSFSVR
jgi:hypothetical protein